MKKAKLLIGLAILAVFLGILLPKEKGMELDQKKEKVTSSTEEQIPEDFQEVEFYEEQGTVKEPEKDETMDLPESSTIIIEPETSKEQGVVEYNALEQGADEQGKLQFPLEITGYNMEIETMGAYTGVFVEDGTNETVSEIAMLQVKNTGNSVIEYAELQIVFFSQILNFEISALPAGESAILLEQQRKTLPEESLEKCIATVVHREQMEMSEKQVMVTDAENNRLRIKNLTDEVISTVRVFYKYYVEDKDIFLGGIAFSVKLSQLEAGGELVIQPAHYQSDFCRIVMVSTYDTPK